MKYKKKPVVIEAEIYREGMEDGYVMIEKRYCKNFSDKGFTVDRPDKMFFMGKDRIDIDSEILIKLHPALMTLEGWHEISEGDYIITGIKGERYPCKPDIFEMTYDVVEE